CERGAVVMQVPELPSRPQLVVDEDSGDVHLQRNVEDDPWRERAQRAQEGKRVLDMLEHVDAQQQAELLPAVREVLAMERQALVLQALRALDRRRRDIVAGEQRARRKPGLQRAQDASRAAADLGDRQRQLAAGAAQQAKNLPRLPVAVLLVPRRIGRQVLAALVARHRSSKSQPSREASCSTALGLRLSCSASRSCWRATTTKRAPKACAIGFAGSSMAPVPAASQTAKRAGSRYAR